ncbi:MAG: heliorhodopsin HeR [Solirubrobacterales bacterium]|nr:heliorhodopsin HeR [Solirubrobacterales bacterium]
MADKSEPRSSLARLSRLNRFAAVFFTVQVVVLLVLAEPVSLPVVGSFLVGPPGAGDYGSTQIFDLRIDLIVALFLALAAVDHLVVGTVARGRYESNVERGQNPFRWYEYSISASVMIVLIAMLTGVKDVTALIAIFGANAAMIFFGLVMERANLDRERVDWTPFILGCVIGAVPWIAIIIQFILAETSGRGIPGFVYGIFVSLFILFNCFAVNMWLSYRRRGRWKDPLFSEKVYVWLSITAKTALAIQVYSGALAGS